jgi:hypothetical protein
MLLLAVNGTKGGKLPNGLTTKLEQAAYFYAKKLKMSDEDSFIEIKVPRKRGFIDGCIGGLCSAADEEHDAGYEYMHIIIDLANVTFSEMLRNLAHEMVHAKQYLKGELCVDVQSWKGIRFQSKLGSDYDINAPWEKEAYRRETLLYKKLLDHYGENYGTSRK